jgi:hypothetical protein
MGWIDMLCPGKVFTIIKITVIERKITYETIDEKIDLLMYLHDLILLNKTPRKTPIMPYTNRVTIIAPIKEEYLAKSPNIPTAWDSISPEVSEINACEAKSGINRPLTEMLKIKDMANAANPAATPQTNSTA